MECPICFELISNEAYSTFCGHIFCGCVITANLTVCPVCMQTVSADKIHKIYFPHAPKRTGENMDEAIVQSLATTVAADQKKTETKFAEFGAALEALQLMFSQSDSIYEAYRAENNVLKQEVEQLKAKVKVFEDFLTKKEKDQKEQDMGSAIDSLYSMVNEKNLL